MKIVVDTPEEYQDWLKSQKTIVNAIADEKAAKAAESTPVATTVVIKKVDSAKVAVVATPVAVK
jgi:cytochrome c oxidase subunit 2